MTLREGKRYPPVCVTCGAATTRSSMVERVASKRKWPLAALGAFGIAMGLATLLPGRAMPVGPSGYALVFLIVGGLALLRRGLMPGVSIQVRVPHCPGCKLPEVDTIDPREGSITMVVHDAFRHETH